MSAGTPLVYGFPAGRFRGTGMAKIEPRGYAHLRRWRALPTGKGFRRNRVRVLTRFLVVFMALRVLAPPGVCVCEVTRPVQCLLADACGAPRPPAHCDEEDPVCGCTLCQLPPGVVVKHVSTPPPAPSAEPHVPTAPAA